jgi:hypothetical protein
MTDQTSEPRTAEEKITRTVRDLSVPDEDAGAFAMSLSSLAMMAEGRLDLAEQQQTGELDEFIRDLTRWIAGHRSDTAKRLVVVELPRREELPAGTRLHCLDEAIEAAEHPEMPL